MFERMMCFFLGILGWMVLPDLLAMIHGGAFQQHQLFYILILTLVNLGLAYLMRKYKVLHFRWLRGREWLTFVVLLFLTVFSLKLYSLLFPGLHSSSTEGFAELFKSRLSLAFWLDVLLLGPIMEELLMRGLLQKGAFQQKWWGVFLSAAIFSVGHSINNVNERC